MEERINVAELLKDCPKGMELDCAMYDNVTLETVFEGCLYPIRLQMPEGFMDLTKYGSFSLNTYSKCVIFPKGETTWNNISNISNYKDGDILYCKSLFDWVFIYKHTRDYGIYRYVALCCDNNKLYAKPGRPLLDRSDFKEVRFATEEEKQKLFDAIKANGYRWDEETKTLEKLIIPKFNISTLKPFDKVFVRDTDTEEWVISFFSHCNEIDEYTHHCINGCRYVQCIPYEHNEHLLGTNNDCDDFYKNWEE